MRLNKQGIFGAVATLAASLQITPALAQQPGLEPVPARRAGEGEGPYPKLVIRGAMVIPGDGGPPYGPADVVIEGNRIASVELAGAPGTTLKAEREPRDATREIDGTGQYVLPGFIDMHGHNGDPEKAPSPTYGYKLWLAHGVTSVRGVSFYWGDAARNLAERRLSAESKITAPRLFPYVVVGSSRVDLQACKLEYSIVSPK